MSVSLHARCSGIRYSLCLLSFVSLSITRNLDVLYVPIPMAARSKEWVCGCSRGGVVGSNPTGGMDVYVLKALCVVR